MIVTKSDNIKNENIAVDTSDNLHNRYINTLKLWDILSDYDKKAETK